ncbi:MAG: hypothetical protein ITG02_13785 [Patulibacter sp.]|nr:hypothetical protein [Patulibacter sp.]
MSTDDKQQPTTISLVPATVAFAVGSVITVVGAYLIMLYNSNGNVL